MLIRALAPFQIEFDGKLRLELQAGQLADVPGGAAEDAIARGAARAATPGEAGLQEPEPATEPEAAAPASSAPPPPPFAITLLGEAPPRAAGAVEDDEPTHESPLAAEED